MDTVLTVNTQPISTTFSSPLEKVKTFFFPSSSLLLFHSFCRQLDCEFRTPFWAQMKGNIEMKFSTYRQRNSDAIWIKTKSLWCDLRSTAHLVYTQPPPKMFFFFFLALGYLQRFVTFKAHIMSESLQYVHWSWLALHSFHSAVHNSVSAIPCVPRPLPYHHDQDVWVLSC